MEPMTLQKPKIGAEEVRRAAQILKKYKQGKAHLESRIIDNEQFWKMRHWQQMEKNGQGGNPGDPQPTSGWLVNCILSKHADAMDCYPEPTVLPREEGDRMEARKLTKILPVVLKQNQFKRTYSDAWWYKLKSGCAAYGVFWDAGKLGGLGDISIRRMDLLNLFWEPGVRDIQDSEHFFSTELVSNEQLLRRYPQLEGKLGGGSFTVSRFLYDDTVWGCKYGMVDGETVNEIYASKLGDFKNWRCFQGLSTDSYAAARGSDGVFTGAVSYLGNPIFLKERCMERVYAADSGAHQIITTECSGVQKGSEKSLQVVGGVLYYLSGDGVQAFDGSLPVTVSQVLGEKRCHGGVGGAWRGKYYLSALDEEEAAPLLVYDSERRQWHREDGLRATAFVGSGGELYCLASDGKLWSMHGQSGEKENDFAWMAETGEVGMQSPERKRLTRLLLHLRPERGKTVTAWLSYDGGASWTRQGQATGNGSIREQVIAMRPRQCRALRLKLTGSGQCAIFALTALYERGGDGL